jgi:hypothetical protein
MYNLYDINFQSNSKICKIRIRYNVIHSLMHHGMEWIVQPVKLKVKELDGDPKFI